MKLSHSLWLAHTALLALGPSGAAAAATAIPGAPTRVEACSATKIICVNLSTERVNGTPLRKGYRWGGEDIEPPQSLIFQLTVSAHGNDVFVPLSAFADLGNPQTVAVRSTGKGFDVIVTGGDASAAYRAHLVFEGGVLIRRKVQHGEFPSEAWEDTRYKFNRLEN